MSAFTHTATIFNRGRDGEQDQATVLRGVLLEETRGVVPGTGGMQRQNEARLFVPFSVQAEDALTGRAREYAEPEAFRTMEDRSGHWTLEAGGGCFFIKGEAAELSPGAYRADRVKTRDFGSEGLRHFEVRGR